MDRLGPTYLQKYAHDICISACEWIKLRAQQFRRVSQHRDTLVSPRGNRYCPSGLRSNDSILNSATLSIKALHDGARAMSVSKSDVYIYNNASN